MTMRPALARWAVPASVLAVALAVPAAAQIDYRNLDDDRPTRVEDAYPAERYAFAFLLPYSFERERGGAWVQASILELAYGLLRNAHVGVKAPLAGVGDGGTTEWGLSGIRALALYNFNTESQRLPALSLRTDAVFPVGGLAGSETHVGVMTRDDWLMMGHHMGGIEAMGGPVLGLLRSPGDSTTPPRRMPTMDHRP